MQTFTYVRICLQLKDIVIRRSLSEFKGKTSNFDQIKKLKQVSSKLVVQKHEMMDDLCV